jgi:hypothetical protein
MFEIARSGLYTLFVDCGLDLRERTDVTIPGA